MISRSHTIRVLGVDPASAGATGFGVVESCAGRCSAVHYGALPAARRSSSDIPARLREIHEQTSGLIEKFQPTQIALEAIFAALNVKTAIRLAEVRGVILLAAAQAGLPVRSYSPREVKMTIAGYGHASKEQIQHMVRALLALEETPQPADAADALAVALCHLRYAEMEAKFGVPAQMLPATRSTRAAAARAARNNNSSLARVLSAR
jgi:crossover junction endodeoxyribonuclease RuvC